MAAIPILHPLRSSSRLFVETLIAGGPKFGSPRPSFRHPPSVATKCLMCYSGGVMRPYSTQKPSSDPPSGSSSSSPSPPSSSPNPNNPTLSDAPLLTAEKASEQSSAAPASFPSSRESSDIPRSSDPAVPNPTPAEDELPSATDLRRSLLHARFVAFMDNAQRAATEASNWASNATGTSYRGIERLKAQNAEMELTVSKAREDLARARAEYQSVVERRLATQREVNTLLARKDGWTATDLERFTSLYRADHTLDTEVSRAGDELARMERDTERLRERLISGILGRYHEEQIWSDRIRRLSTWGTWGLMGVNVLLFLLFQFGAEPWRRQKLVRGFEEKVAEGVKKVLEEERERASAKVAPVPLVADGVAVAGTTEETKEAVTADDVPPEATEKRETDDQAKVKAVFEPLVPAAPAVPLTLRERTEAILQDWKDFATHPARWKSDLKKVQPAVLWSDRKADLRWRDVTLMMAESMITGAVIATIFFWRAG